MKQIFTITLLGICQLVSSGVYASQTCNSNMLKTKPSIIYKDNANGTVTDTKTKLMWQKCSVGQTYSAGSCTGIATTATWDAALKAANSQVKFGYSDWRVPNVNELKSLVEIACYSPSNNETIFPASTNSYYWSASPYANYNYHVWVVNFDIGGIHRHNKTNSNYVRLVRTGQ